MGAQKTALVALRRLLKADSGTDGTWMNISFQVKTSVLFGQMLGPASQQPVEANRPCFGDSASLVMMQLFKEQFAH